VAIDYICTVERIPECNSSSPVIEMGRFFGGGAANVSAVIASLGGRVRLFSVAGGDFFTSGYASHLKSLGVDISGVKALEDGRSAHAFIFNDPEGNQISFFYWGVSKKMSEMEISEGLEFVHIATGAPEVNRKIARAADFLSFDAGQDIYGYTREDILDILKFTNILFSNEHEMEFITKRCGMSEKEIAELVDILVITCGARGSRIISGGEEEFVPPLKVDAVDPTGAGDAYKGGFLFSLVSGFSLRECAEIGSVCASFIVEAWGAQTKLPRWDEVRERWRNLRGESP